MKKPFARLTGLLAAYEIDGTRFAEILGSCPRTARSRLKSPENLTLAELAKIRPAGVPAEEIREAITFK